MWRLKQHSLPQVSAGFLSILLIDKKVIVRNARKHREAAPTVKHTLPDLSNEIRIDIVRLYHLKNGTKVLQMLKVLLQTSSILSLQILQFLVGDNS